MVLAENNKITFNVRGEIFQTYRKTLKRFPHTLLGKLNEKHIWYCRVKREYKIDRSRKCFGAILFFYQTEILSRPLDIPIKIFVDECEHFELPEDLVSQLKLKEGILDQGDESDDEEIEHGRSFQARTWDILENPETSKHAKIYAIFSLSIILISIVTACLETVKVLNVKEIHWSNIELGINCWFLLELVMRFAASPNKTKFLKSISNWIDGTVVIPYFLMIIFVRGRVKSLGFLRCFRFVRVLRLFRLSKHNKRIQIIMHVAKLCIGDFQMLLLCLLIVVTLGASITYFMEIVADENGRPANEQFSSIPESMWWSIATLTTVGYGDISPTTALGKMFAAAYMVFGAVFMFLPILTVVNTFIKVYSANIPGENRLFM